MKFFVFLTALTAAKALESARALRRGSGDHASDGVSPRLLQQCLHMDECSQGACPMADEDVPMVCEDRDPTNFCYKCSCPKGYKAILPKGNGTVVVPGGDYYLNITPGEVVSATSDGVPVAFRPIACVKLQSNVDPSPAPTLEAPTPAPTRCGEKCTPCKETCIQHKTGDGGFQYSCECSLEFARLFGVGTACQPMKQLSCPNEKCAPHAICNDFKGGLNDETNLCDKPGFECICRTGFSGNGIDKSKPFGTGCTKITSAPTAPVTPQPTYPPATPSPTPVPSRATLPPIGVTGSPSANCWTSTTRSEYFRGVLSLITDPSLLADPNSPQGKAFAFLIDDTFIEDVCTFPTLEQRYGLATVYYATNGASWKSSTNWVTATPECAWFGITCSSITNTIVEKLELPSNRLSGSLPNEISTLSEAVLLNVFRNSIGGTLPTGLVGLTKLKSLDLESNAFAGELFTPGLLSLTDLTELRGSFNDFTGTIPRSIESLTKLKQLWFANNRIAGTVPTELTTLSGLESLFAYRNMLNGAIPVGFGALVNLTHIRLYNNVLTGTLPNDLFDATRLETIQLENQFLTGTIPTTIGNLVFLENVRLSNNTIVGSIPSEIGGLLLLETLTLHNNFLSGALADSTFGPMSRLEYIDLSNNNFLMGTLPSTIFDIPSVKYIYIANCSLTGTLPTKYVSPPVLRDLYLDGNKMTGTIPQVASGKLLHLNEFLLNNNRFTGSMPASVCALRYDAFLDDLFSDCGGNLPEVVCDFPDCCNRCFDSEKTLPPPTLSPTPLPPGATHTPTSGNCLTGTTRSEYLRGILSLITDPSLLADQNSPQGMAFTFLIADTFIEDVCTFPTLEQRYGLATVYYATNGASWKSSTNWGSATPECTWFGITCSSITNTIVEKLELHANRLSGSLPDEISTLSEALLLGVSRNSIGGTLPTGLVGLTKLKSLDLESNAFAGELFTPGLLSLTDLTELRGSFNDFTGTIPRSIESLTKLKQLWFANNRIAGTVPTELTTLSGLESLFAYRNMLNGAIPVGFGALVNLTHIRLYQNSLTGTLPNDLFDATRLETIQLENQFLTGTIPTTIGNLVFLEDLRLSNNTIVGSIPSEIGGLLLLETLKLNNNFLSGSLADSTFGPTSRLEDINLSNNKLLMGTLPATLFDIPFVGIIYIANCSLTGTLPTNYGSPSFLTELYLDGNKMTGTIPEVELDQNWFLFDFRVHHNQFTGSMPTSICALRDLSGIGFFNHLWSDCLGNSPEVACDFPSCCNRCFR